MLAADRHLPVPRRSCRRTHGGGLSRPGLSGSVVQQQRRRAIRIAPSVVSLWSRDKWRLIVAHDIMTAQDEQSDTKTEPVASINARAGRWKGGLTFAVFGLLFCFMIVHSVRHAPVMPFWDGWEMVAKITGHEPVTLAWLWSPHNEHRILLPRLLYIGIARLTGVRMGAMAGFSVTLMGAAALIAMLTVRRLRGRWSWTDIVVPAVFLSAVHRANLLWPFQIGFILPTFIVVCLVAGISLTRTLTWRTVAGVGIGALALPMCGGPGIPPALMSALWLIFAAWTLWQCKHRKTACAGWLLALTILVLVGFYFVGLERVPHHPDPAGPFVSAYGGLHCAFTAFGRRLARDTWPWIMVASLPFVIALVCHLVRAAKREEGERPRVAGLLAMLMGIGGIAWGIARSRTLFAPENFDWCTARYATLMSPAILIAYLSLVLYRSDPDESDGFLGKILHRCLRALPMLLLVLAIAGSAREVSRMRKTAKRNDERNQQLIHALAQKADLENVVDSQWQMWYVDKDKFRRHLKMLHEYRASVFRHRQTPTVPGGQSLNSDQALR